MSQHSRPSSIVKTNTSCHGSIFKFLSNHSSLQVNGNNNDTKYSDIITEYELHNLIRGEGVLSNVQDDPSEPDSHRRQGATIDLSPKDDGNDKPNETEDKPTEDISATKLALASDKDRIPESLLLLKKIDITPAPTPPAQRPATRVTVPLGSTGVHRMPLRADEPSRLTFPL